MSTNKAIFDLKTKGTGHTHPEAERVIAKAAKKPQTRLNVMVDQEEHKAFRLAAMKQGKTMSDLITAYIKDFLSKNDL